VSIVARGSLNDPSINGLTHLSLMACNEAHHLLRMHSLLGNSGACLDHGHVTNPLGFGKLLNPIEPIFRAIVDVYEGLLYPLGKVTMNWIPS